MDRVLPLDGERWKAADSDGVINLLSERAWLTVALDHVVGDVDDQEARLRQLEYEADLLAAEGREGIDTAWLRQELYLDPSLPSRRPTLAFAYDS